MAVRRDRNLRCSCLNCTPGFVNIKFANTEFLVSENKIIPIDGILFGYKAMRFKLSCLVPSKSFDQNLLYLKISCHEAAGCFRHDCLVLPARVMSEQKKHHIKTATFWRNVLVKSWYTDLVGQFSSREECNIFYSSNSSVAKILTSQFQTSAYPSDRIKTQCRSSPCTDGEHNVQSSWRQQLRNGKILPGCSWQIYGSGHPRQYIFSVLYSLFLCMLHPETL